MTDGGSTINATFHIVQGITGSSLVAHSLCIDQDRSTGRQARAVRNDDAPRIGSDVVRETEPGLRCRRMRRCVPDRRARRRRQSPRGRWTRRRRGSGYARRHWNRARWSESRRRGARRHSGLRADAFATRPAVAVIAAGIGVEISTETEAPGRDAGATTGALAIVQTGEALVGSTTTDLLAAHTRGVVLAIVIDGITAFGVERAAPTGTEAAVGAANRAGVADTAGTIAREPIRSPAVTDPLNNDTRAGQTVDVSFARAAVVRTRTANEKLTGRALRRTRHPDQEDCNQNRRSYSALTHIIPQGLGLTSLLLDQESI